MRGRIRGILWTALLTAALAPAPCACGGRGKPGTGAAGGTVRLHPVFEKGRGSVFLLGGDEAGLMGTAFLVEHGKKRYVVSNFHVVAFIRNIFIQSEDEVAYKDVHLLAADRKNDVAVLEAEGLPAGMKALAYTLEYATSQPIFVIGYPDMRSSEDHVNFGPGVISDADYIAPVYMGEGTCSNIQITAPISPGHSGSPVLDEQSRVLGVVAWSFTPEDDIVAGNYAVPFRHVLDLIEEIESRKDPHAPPDVAAGQTCRDDGDCPWTLFCIEGACRELKDLGEPCLLDEDCYLPYICTKEACARAGILGETCRNDSQCEPPYYCILETCGPLRKKGETCAIDIDCVEPLYCVAGKCAADLSSEGGPCNKDADCWAPLVCEAGTCRSKP
jgi:hypothetical protein